MDDQYFENSKENKNNYNIENAEQDLSKMMQYGGTGLIPIQERLRFFIKLQSTIIRLQKRMIDIQEKQIREQAEYIDNHV